MSLKALISPNMRIFNIGGQATGRLLLMAAAAAVMAPSPATADLTSWNLSPYSASLGDLNFNLAGDANGAAFARTQPPFPDLASDGASGALRIFPSLERDYDSGLIVAFRTSILAYHDHLSVDRYRGEVFEKAYASVETGLGTFEVGDTDGPGYRLAITGPRVDEKASLDDPEMTFFENPVTRRAFDEVFTVRTEAGDSLNDAKFAYYSPRLFGLQLAFSFAPSEGKDVVPFVSSGTHLDDRQENLWELGANYTDDFGPVSLGAYGALSVGRDAAKTVGHEGLTDWALGTALVYTINDDWKLSAGASYRQANAYAFDINDVLSLGSTRAMHASASISFRSWTAGFETVDGIADGSGALPSLGLHGYESELGYALNANLALTLGWQRLNYSRSNGDFYSGPKFHGDAYFLHADFHV